MKPTILNFDLAKTMFKQYVEKFDVNDDKIKLKIVHTYHVVDFAEYIAKKEKFSEEDVQLAKLIALLHDIGRFKQVAMFNDFRDIATVDHGKLGVETLSENHFIRKFIPDNQYDDIIYKAVLSHNQFEIEANLNERELLQSKIIRDADKIDNFRVKEEEKIETLLYLWNKEEIENSVITDKVYSDFMNAKCIKNEDRITAADYWVSYFAFLFDFNFNSSLKYISQENYISRNINRIQFKNKDTQKKMQIIQNFALDYLKSKINS